MNIQMNFIKLCDQYYQSDESSILLDNNEVLFLNEEQIVLYKDIPILSHDLATQADIVLELEKEHFLKVSRNDETYFVLELNFQKRKTLLEGHYKTYLFQHFEMIIKDGSFYINQSRVKICIERDSCTLTIIADDNVQKRQIDLPRKAYFLVQHSDQSYHYEQALSQWIRLQIRDFEPCNVYQKLNQAELLGAILQDLSNLDVQVNQDLDKPMSNDVSKVQIDINKENLLLLQNLNEIRCIQLPHNLQLINDNEYAYEFIKVLILTLFDDLKGFV